MLNFSLFFFIFILIKKKWGRRIRVSFNACRNLKTAFPQSRDEF